MSTFLFPSASLSLVPSFPPSPQIIPLLPELRWPPSLSKASPPFHHPLLIEGGRTCRVSRGYLLSLGVPQENIVQARPNGGLHTNLLTRGRPSRTAMPSSPQEWRRPKEGSRARPWIPILVSPDQNAHRAMRPHPTPPRTSSQGWHGSRPPITGACSTTGVCLPTPHHAHGARGGPHSVSEITLRVLTRRYLQGTKKSDPY